MQSVMSSCSFRARVARAPAAQSARRTAAAAPRRATPRCSAVNEGSSAVLEKPAVPPAEASLPLAADAAPAAPPPNVLPTFYEAMSFGGYAPETINGRAAMVGFILAIHNEVHARGHPMLSQQFHSLGGGLAFIFVAGLLTVATFAPDIQRAVGADYEETGAVARATYTSDPASRPQYGPFTLKGEQTNGRAAMIGIASMLLIESLMHAPLF